MTFEEARKSVAALAGKEAYAVRYELMAYQVCEDAAKDARPTCSVYVRGHGWHGALMWAEAIRKLSDSMGITPASPSADPSEAPGEEAGK